MRIGAARTEIRFEADGVGMMGYGRWHNRIAGRATPLYSRAFCFESGGALLFFAQAEVCMVFPEIKRAVLELAGRVVGAALRDDNLMLVSQHTHSAPGGYSHFPFYNFAVPGFRPAIFEALVASLAQALVEAWQARREARLKFSRGDFPDNAPVAFNRSLAAYNRNPAVQPLRDDQCDRAIERTMWLLLAEDAQGRPIGQINWFGVHPTSIGNRNRLVSYDNKGYAAEYLEQALGPGTVAIFAQQFAGDVSPNNQGRTMRGWPKGPTRDEHENARINGRLQCEQAQRILAAMADAEAFADTALDCALVRKDFADLEIDADLAGGTAGLRTAPPAHGLAFFHGSPVDGPGAPGPVIALLRLLAKRARRRRLARGNLEDRAEELAQAPKLVVSRTAAGELLGLRDVQRLPGLLDPLLREMQRQAARGALDEKPWVPSVLPLQYLRLGPLALIGFPGEITTEAGRQLRALCRELLAPAGVRDVLISSYANAYFGYCTTWHEYQQQQYEGGHTTFGSRTHDAFRGEYRRLLRECLKPPQQRRLASAEEQRFSAAALARRTVM